MCEEKYTKLGLQTKFQDQLDEDIKKHSELIRVYLDKIKSIFTQQSAENLVETYKTQINSMVLKTNKTIATQNNNILIQTQANRHTNDLATSMPFYQCLLGSIEALIEHSFTNGSYKAMQTLYKKFNQVFDIAYKQLTNTGDDEKKKKEPPKKKPTAAKKKKENKNPNNHSDDDIKATHADVTALDELSTTSKPLLESTTNDLTLNAGKKKQQTKSALKKANTAKFFYVHRISVSVKKIL